MHTLDLESPSRRSSGNLNSNYFSTIWTSERPPLYKAVALNPIFCLEVTAECATALTAFQSSTNQINIGDHGNDNYLIYSFTVLLIPFDIHLWILKDLYCLKFHKGAWQNHLESNLKTLLLWIFDLIIKDATQYIYNRIWDPIFPNGEELLKEILTRIKSHQFHAICLTVWIYEAAYIYRKIITRLMDLTTVEQRSPSEFRVLANINQERNII
ncbi:hypothetical protein GLOIN_2v1692294 [Rhizophagus irregularis DAOM 181602=DAOM 197198]|nr:hypothetical protein GLOIN_2v1692294 [Rhizophagus irregularis DAOM 181602=DAOM 197198]